MTKAESQRDFLDMVVRAIWHKLFHDIAGMEEDKVPHLQAFTSSDEEEANISYVGSEMYVIKNDGTVSVLGEPDERYDLHDPIHTFKIAENIIDDVTAGHFTEELSKARDIIFKQLTQAKS